MLATTRVLWCCLVGLAVVDLVVLVQLVRPTVWTRWSERARAGDQSPSVWRQSDFECLRWVAIDDDGRQTGETRECWQRVRGGESGYCEIRNASSGERRRVLFTTSLSLKPDVRYTCRLARAFSDFHARATSYRHDPPMPPADSTRREQQGIVMAVYERVLPSAYASIRRLRAVGCRLPIELWFRFDELSVEHVLLQHLIDVYGPIRSRVIHDERAQGFNVKVHAVYFSFAMRDPTPLFSSTLFQLHGGAIFWPDFWHPGNTIFNVHAQSPVWEMLGLEPVDMLEQESGQVLIDRRRNRAALERLMFFATHRPNLFYKLQLVWGDKDLFRLAWLHAGQPFYFHGTRLPGSLGAVHPQRERFCGMSMVQYDLDGKGILFVHRNTIKLVGNGAGEKRIWHALQEYQAGAWPPPNVLSFNGEKLFNETSCFGVKRFAGPEKDGLVVMRYAHTSDT
ncbi:hypothetical protein P43SY_005213 [Pythium insidiosum]|uniref:Uncharacterized protein n=1 Tax=Pythium insidiosum TaxID=114742 RepID=A0AAD5M737_PYTIN|nr:hypothetical protein P43SY_005213 [Pythium insidiosum]